MPLEEHPPKIPIASIPPATSGHPRMRFIQRKGPANGDRVKPNRRAWTLHAELLLEIERRGGDGGPDVTTERSAAPFRCGVGGPPRAVLLRSGFGRGPAAGSSRCRPEARRPPQLGTLGGNLLKYRFKGARRIGRFHRVGGSPCAGSRCRDVAAGVRLAGDPGLFAGGNSHVPGL